MQTQMMRLTNVFHCLLTYLKLKYFNVHLIFLLAGLYMAMIRSLHSIHLSSLHTTRGFEYCDEFNLLGIVGDNVVCLTVNCSKLKNEAKIMSQHSYPTIARFSPAGSPNPSFLLGGPVDIYDTQSLCLLRSYLEHNDKVTGINWSSREKHLFASCSKDGTVKLYDLSLPHSHSTVTMDMNVCGVRSNPFNLNQIAFGTAQGKYFVYDTRKLSSPYLEVKGHSKTVTCVMFVSETEILSMSLDSMAKLWDLNHTVCVENYIGHVHHTHFVGIDCTLLMGGEDSSLRVYAKHRCNPIACEKITTVLCLWMCMDKSQFYIN